MNQTEYNTLIFVALLQGINELSAGSLAQKILTAHTAYSDVDSKLLNNLLASTDDGPVGKILRQTHQLTGTIYTPNAVDSLLASVFDLIELAEARPPDPMVYPQVPWSQVGDKVFPIRLETIQPAGRDILNRFQTEFIDLFEAAANFQVLYAGTLTLVNEHLWAIPSSDTASDIPLSEVLRLNSAVAACLYRRSQMDEIDNPENPLTLLTGDLSGIQNYVFGITEGGKSEEGTGKRLRARSLFVQLLAEVGMQQALQVYNLPLANVLMASGGKFHLLWPGLSNNADKCQALQQEIDRWLLAELNGEIGLALAYTPVSPAQLQHGFGDVLNRVEAELRRAKHAKFQTRLQDANGWDESRFVLHQVDFKGNGACHSCGKFPIADDSPSFCRHCRLDQKIGQKIKQHAHWLAFSKQRLTGDDISVLDSYVSVWSKPEEVGGAPYLLFQLGGSVQPSSTIPTLWRSSAPYVNSELRFLPMAKAGEGRELLGYLKADVDNLGAIFQWGLKRDKGSHLDTPARLSTLSRQFDRFFGDWLSRHLADKYKSSYTVFAGGDDLFVIGRWDLITQLAQDLQASFSRFVGDNPDVTLSAGIALVKPRYPLGLAAEQAEALLDQAKKDPALERAMADQNQSKDQVALLNDVLTWHTYAMVLQEQDKLQAGNPTSAFLYQLLQYADMWRQFAVNGDTNGLRFQPKLAYNLTRNVKRRSSLWQWAERFVNIKLDPPSKAVLNHLQLISGLVILTQQSGKD